ncbi:MAG TPA: flavin reductase family protein [Pseudomonadales bacterium]|nr:flavin reductase family protein [Pseudomonadales bacterium]
MTPTDSKALRNAFGHFATGVTVVTTMGTDPETGEAKPVAMTANSFSSVSLDPPLVLWSIDKGSKSYGAYTHNDHFAIHVLHRGQQDLSNRCASRDIDKFAGLEWTKGIGDAPLFNDFSCRFQCRVEHRYEGGDHQIIVGRVLDYDCNTDAEHHQPLLFFKGQYRDVA